MREGTEEKKNVEKEKSEACGSSKTGHGKKREGMRRKRRIQLKADIVQPFQLSEEPWRGYEKGTRETTGNNKR